MKAWFPGGSSAPVLTEAELDLPYTFEDLAGAGSMLGSGSIIVADDTVSIPELALHGALLSPRVVRQVHAVSRGDQLDGEDARAAGSRRGDADRPRGHRLGAETSSGTACACSATRWRCRLARWWPSSGPSSTSTSTTFRRPPRFASGGGRVSGSNGGRRLMAERPQIDRRRRGRGRGRRGRDARRCRQGR